ncbi:MAG: general secretion pathway protein H [Bradymonadia bacterium]
MTHLRTFPRHNAGITLVEIMVVLAIMAGMAGAAVTVVNSITNANLRAEAMRMSGSLRMIYGRSAINGIRYQLNIDLDGNTYSVSCSEDNVLVEPEARNEREERRRQEDAEADPFNLGGGGASMQDCSEPLLQPRDMRPGVEIARVLTMHHREPVESGSAEVAYFPNGFVERTLIWLRQDEAWLTLEIDPMSGRVFVHAGEIDVPDDFFEVEED